MDCLALLAGLIAISSVQAQQQTWYGQCGGIGYAGPTVCGPGVTCSTMNSYYAQCSPLPCTSNQQTQCVYGQCGGSNWNGPTKCQVGASCSTKDAYYAQCTPATVDAGPTTSKSMTTTTSSTSKSTSTSTTKSTTKTSKTSSTSTSKTSKTSKTSTTSTTSTSTSTSTTSTSSTKPAASGKVQFAGVNIPGCEFGCDTSGSCSNSYCPSSVGPTQMQHFAQDDKLNIFRLPFGWQYMVNYNLGGTLDPNFFATFDALVQSCLSTGARCIADCHNYARWNGGIIGQGGPTNDQFVSLWSQLAKKYANQPRVVFGLMNEPHDLNMQSWAQSVQLAVNAIRAAGASSQWILLPGTDYTSAGTFVANSAPALSSVKNPDGTTTGLIYEVHRYYDSDGSGTSSECQTDHISDSFAPLAAYLRQNKRLALLGETGGGNTQSCLTDVCAALDYVNQNADVYLGWLGWAAGNFDSSYTLSEVPNGKQDTPMVQQCIAGKFK